MIIYAIMKPRLAIMKTELAIMKIELAIMKIGIHGKLVKKEVKALPFTHECLIHRLYSEKVEGWIENIYRVGIPPK